MSCFIVILYLIDPDVCICVYVYGMYDMYESILGTHSRLINYIEWNGIY